MGVFFILLGFCLVVASLVLSIIALKSGKTQSLSIPLLIVGMALISFGRKINKK